MHITRGLLALPLLFILTAGQTTNDCPREWWPNAGSCYLFVFRPVQTVQEAVLQCQMNHSTLLAVNSDAEHRFINSWLIKQDGERQEWLTSGFRDARGRLLWTGDNSEVSNFTNFFPDDVTRAEVTKDPVSDLALNRVVYRYVPARQSYLWAWQRIMVARPFICELSQKDVWKVYQMARDFSFGTGITDPNKWLMGPKIVKQSIDTVFFTVGGSVTPVVLECESQGNPAPTYRWVRKSLTSATLEEVNPMTLGSRFAIVNGRLTIDPASRTEDISTYTCLATNMFGTVMSNPIRLSYGHIEIFSNVRPSAIIATKYKGTVLTCQPQQYSPAVTYSWFKGWDRQFIRPSLNAQYFLSRSGKFYISEVQDADVGQYFCTVYLAPGSGQRLATTQTRSVLSTGMELQVLGSNPNTYGPDIHDQFPQYFPELPFIGETVNIECLAYGRLPLVYSWHRDDAAMNPDARVTDHGRVLVIPNARLEDTGVYTCIVRGVSDTRNKSRVMTLNARPTFPYPLENQHVDLGSPLTWICNVIAVPRATFKWRFNGVELRTNASMGITINGNILKIAKVDKTKHDGMYQCEATNDHGTGRSSAQLRAVAFAPNFNMYPVDKIKQAALGGNITLHCSPQAAPRASIRWLHNGGEVGQSLPSGDLELSFLTTGDAGTYTCVASNDLGEAQNATVLNILEGSVFTNEPIDNTVLVNGTLELPCEVSFDQSESDIVYMWMFNDHMINFNLDNRDAAHYRMPYLTGQSNSGELRIISAKFTHEGYYTCVVRTNTAPSSRRAYIKVTGPPGEPMGVHASNSSRQQGGSVDLMWLPGTPRGFPVTKYRIQARSEWDRPDEWDTVVQEVAEADVTTEVRPNWRHIRITSGLSPGTSYYFRVIAGSSAVGYGPPSINSTAVRMSDAAPKYAPAHIGGGGGSVGQLQVTWNPLPRDMWGGPGMRYNVYYRIYDELNVDEQETQWQTSGHIQGSEFYTVISKELFYTPYQVKVQAMNNLGRGPNSSVTIVYSAEDMPVIQPTNIWANPTNATAGYANWELEGRSRENVRGTVLAFQINFWDEEDTKCLGVNENRAKFTRCYGDVTTCLLVGLHVASDSCFNIQFMNRAGLGSKTDNYYMGLDYGAPERYPEYVIVTSHGRESIRVTFRGVSTWYPESSLRGYKIWWWDVREDIRSAKEEDLGMMLTGVVHGIEKNSIYKLRVLPYSSGGYGKKSIEVYFTLGGQVVYDPSTTLLKNHAHFLSAAHALSLVCLVAVTVLRGRVVG